MKLFFSIDPAVKASVIKRITEFQSHYFHQQAPKDDDEVSESWEPQSPSSKPAVKNAKENARNKSKLRSSSETFNAVFESL